ncbi:DNA-binding transcriptional regulator, AcrR family [Arthrobacter alpinus]|uniref:DNA-binding transcriptional regulator, AcrR family n=1 Tax=Arthrobacter alpinus TaxID=656366 RepID=A0A1H5PAC7_9MICC|nr:TetR/AcrR family transcriptional regulator [Arthrobacter alpinus]SEF10620.1 DNA-binding transcriptional regulator, AcrR family [Arthrobacter alpinus]
MTDVTPLDAQPHYTPGAAKLLAAASDLFYREGIHAVGVDAIASAAGVTKKTLYDRFGSKDALIVAYLRERDARWRQYLEAELAHQPKGSIERILAVFDASGRWAVDNCEKGCSAINAHAEMNDPVHPVAVETTRQKKWLRDLLEQLCTEASIADAKKAANTMMLLYEGALVTTGMGTFSGPFTTARESAAHILTALNAKCDLEVQ